MRAAVIGAGSWAVHTHLPALAADPRVELVGVSRLGATALAQVRSRFAVPFASEDYREVLDLRPDVVVVASPPAAHHEHARAALEAGAHVLLEKPVTVDPAQARDLHRLAAELGRHVVVAFGWNHRPLVRRAAELMAERGVGAVESVSVTMSSATRELLSGLGGYPDADPATAVDSRTWTDPAMSGGGYGQAQLSHGLALALGLSGESVAGAFALMSAPGGAPVELYDALTLRLDGGGVGSVSGASLWSGAGGDKHQLAVTVHGSEGFLRVDTEREDLWLWRRDGEVHDPWPAGSGGYEGAGPVANLLDLVAGATRANHSPLELGVRTVEALALAYASAASGRYEGRP